MKKKTLISVKFEAKQISKSKSAQIKGGKEKLMTDGYPDDDNSFIFDGSGSIPTSSWPTR